MKKCWRENPDERPTGKAVLDAMQDHSFMCLRRCTEVISDPDDVLYTNCTDQVGPRGMSRWFPFFQTSDTSDESSTALA